MFNKKLRVDIYYSDLGDGYDYAVNQKQLLDALLQAVPDYRNLSIEDQIRGLFKYIPEEYQKELFENDCNNIDELIYDAKEIIKEKSLELDVYNLFEYTISDMGWFIDVTESDDYIKEYFYDEAFNEFYD